MKEQKEIIKGWIRKFRKGEIIFTSDREDHAFLFEGHNKSICLMFNGRCIKSCKTWVTMFKEVERLNLKEV